MNVVYLYDPKTKLFTSSMIIYSEADKPDNSTYIEPINPDHTGMYDPKWDGKKWVGKSYEEWAAEQPDDPDNEEPVEPAPVCTTEQRMINLLGIQVAKLEAQNK